MPYQKQKHSLPKLETTSGSIPAPQTTPSHTATSSIPSQRPGTIPHPRLHPIPKWFSLTQWLWSTASSPNNPSTAFHQTNSVGCFQISNCHRFRKDSLLSIREERWVWVGCHVVEREQFHFGSSAWIFLSLRTSSRAGNLFVRNAGMKMLDILAFVQYSLPFQYTSWSSSLCPHQDGGDLKNIPPFSRVSRKKIGMERDSLRTPLFFIRQEKNISKSFVLIWFRSTEAVHSSSWSKPFTSGNTL